MTTVLGRQPKTGFSGGVTGSHPGGHPPSGPLAGNESAILLGKQIRAS
ncbi:hypothetical protein [Methyloprofundus sedimenti]|nr:hypothetical protein [Methyloprofundus sedimenti]